jgi:filamentous hemagglutinin family protein
MIHVLDCRCCRAAASLPLLLACSLPLCLLHAAGAASGAGPAYGPPSSPSSPLVHAASPVGPTVTQGSATFTTQGSQLTIQTSDQAVIDWQSFNIGVGQTTTFLEPSSSSVVWNQINDPNPSQILGTLNANGYVILQNQSGFFVGGQASITTHGLVMTTSPTPAPDLSSGGPWQFNAPPLTASIINYGQINVAGGSSAFLIANSIENRGAISAPQGNIGLYAGKQVLISARPDGRGLSAAVTLPEGSVDNSGRLIADAGIIAMQAQVVNQGGLVQANSMREVNGVIELAASDAVNLGPNSVLSAQGGGQGTSPGGTISIKSGNTFSDQPTSIINVSGGPQGGNGGQVEISAPSIGAIHSSIDGRAANGFLAGELTIDPQDILLTSSGNPAPASGTVNAGDPPAAGTLTLDVNSFNTLISQNLLSQINLQASRDIEVATLWNLPNSQNPNASLTLQAGRNITVDNGAGIVAGRNWSLNLIAGTELTSAANIQPGMDRIFLQGSAFIQAQNGNINLTAGNDVFVDDGSSDPNSMPAFNLYNYTGNGITTVAGGNISVTSLYGNINTGGNPFAYTYTRNAPFYSVSTAPGASGGTALGGVSTAAGGNVTLRAAGNITSYLPLQGDPGGDGGSGAFGPEPGNVTVTAGGSVFGHFVEADGTGTVTAGQDVGATENRLAFALSLVKGSWSVFAPDGSIYLQEVRNPNGVFNTQGTTSSPGWHLFDYDPQASVLLEAGDQVDLTGSGVPRPVGTVGFPILYPPSLTIIAGAGGVVLDNDVTLFPSAFGDLTIATTGSMVGVPSASGSTPTLMMSDSGSHQWSASSGVFGQGDHAATPFELNNPDPVSISVLGDFNNLDLITVKRTDLFVGGNMDNSGFSGENLHPGDVTTIDVAGQIYNTGEYSFAYLTQPLGPLWDSIFNEAVNPTLIANTVITTSDLADPAVLKQLATEMALFPTSGNNGNPGFVYDPTTMRLGFEGRMSTTVRNDMDGTLEILQYGLDKLPVVVNGHFATTPVSFVPVSVINTLYQESQSVPVQIGIMGYEIGGPGQFNIRAGSLDLGTTTGIISWGPGDRYASLTQLTPVGAAIDVDVAGDVSMYTSRIVSMYGGSLTVNAGGSMDLGSQELFGSSGDAFGIYSSGHSDVSVTAVGDINIDGSRIAAFNGGNVFVESLEGNVNVGSGGNSYVGVSILRIDPGTGLPYASEAYIFGSGVVTTSLTKDLQTSGSNPLPGNITVLTPQGNIASDKAGVLQMAMDGNLPPGPTITLVAGTKPSATSPGYAGNIDVGDSGVIGGAVTMTAQGSIEGLVVSRQSTTINAAQNFNGTILSAGTANIAAGGTVSGTVIGVSGISASGAKIDASLLSQNVSVGGGASTSTLGSSATGTAASQSAAQQASNDTKEQVAQSSSPAADDDQKRKPAKRPALVRRVGRVTVILPDSSK